MKKRVLALLLAGAAVASLAACGSSDSGASGSGSAAGGDGEVVELVMGNVTSSSAKDAVTEVLIPKVEEYSNGTLKIVHFPDNQLGNDEQSFAMAQTGECDIAVGSTSSVATTYNDLYVYDVPYLFLNKQEVYDVGFNGETGKAILDGFSEYGLKGLAFWENGFRNITTTDKDIATVADLSGLKIRTMANEIHLEAWKAMGANPTPMAFGELFTGLQQGTVDGQENPLGIITGNKFEEVQSYHRAGQPAGHRGPDHQDRLQQRPVPPEAELDGLQCRGGVGAGIDGRAGPGAVAVGAGRGLRPGQHPK